MLSPATSGRCCCGAADCRATCTCCWPPPPGAFLPAGCFDAPGDAPGGAQRQGGLPAQMAFGLPGRACSWGPVGTDGRTSIQWVGRWRPALRRRWSAILAYRCWGLGFWRVRAEMAGFFSNLTPLFAPCCPPRSWASCVLAVPRPGVRVDRWGIAVSRRGGRFPGGGGRCPSPPTRGKQRKLERPRKRPAIRQRRSAP